jgi:hypothetical protein
MGIFLDDKKPIEVSLMNQFYIESLKKKKDQMEKSSLQMIEIHFCGEFLSL